MYKHVRSSETKVAPSAINSNVKDDFPAPDAPRISKPLPSTETQFALTGLSDTANFSLFYEKNRFSGRVSYNWRDEFLDSPVITGNEPQYTEEYSQVDVSLSYELIDDLFVSLEGINITEEDQRQHGRSSAQLTRLEVLGARYALGVRYSF